MLRLCLTLLVAMTGVETAGAETSAPGWPATKDSSASWPDAELGVSEWSSSAAKSDLAKPSSKARAPKRLGKRGSKRKGGMVGWAVPEKQLLAEKPEPPSGNLHIFSAAYKTEAKVNIYNPDGSFSVQALAEVNHIFKCRRSGLEHDIDTRLVTVLSHIYDHFGGKPIEVLSGYRFQRRTTSNHFHGAAADIRIAGVDPRKVRAYAESLDAGDMGVGWYPRVGFVHVDVRKPPSYRWIDYSRSNPDARDRLPPRGFKRRDPQS